MSTIRYISLMISLLAGLAVMAGAASSAQAGPKFGSLWWWHSHWVNQDFVPYYENGTDPHNTQWDQGRDNGGLDSSKWTPADWIALNGGTGPELVQRWHIAHIIDRQYYDDGIPYLDVGVNFYHLSGLDKRRVMQTVDYVYQITGKPPRMFYLRDPATDEIIGSYGRDGLILQ